MSILSSHASDLLQSCSQDQSSKTKAKTSTFKTKTTKKQSL